jgi:hypothetical protein
MLPATPSKHIISSCNFKTLQSEVIAALSESAVKRNLFAYSIIYRGQKPWKKLTRMYLIIANL